MNPTELNRSSWHYKLANFPLKRVYKDTDICSYTRAVLTGMFGALVVSVCTLVLIAFFATAMWNIYDMLFNGAGIEPPAVVFLIIAFVVAWAAIYGYVRARISEIRRARRNEPQDETPPSYLTLLYRKIKDKTCFRISFD